MTLSLNDRARGAADRMADDAEALGLAVETIDGGCRLIDCGARARGGLEAGRQYAEICMAGLGRVAFSSVELDGVWLPALTVHTDRPVLACMASQYAGWQLNRDGYFAMASGPGRALVRAERIYDHIGWEERASAAVFCLEARDVPPPAVVEHIAQRAGVPPSTLTLLLSPTASLAGSVQVAARVVETAMHKLHELGFDIRQVTAGFGTCPLPPVAEDDIHAIGRTNDAVLYGGQVHLVVDADDGTLEELVPRLPSSASAAHGRPFHEILKEAGFRFYDIDPMLFSPARVRISSLRSGRTFEAGAVDAALLARSFFR